MSARGNALLKLSKPVQHDRHARRRGRGAPGLRGEEGPQAFYGAYFRDPDGNKLAAFCIGPAA